MTRRLLIAGDSPEALDLLPSLEANPMVEIRGIVSERPEVTLARLTQRDPALAARLGPRVTADGRAALATPGLVAVIDGGAPPALRADLDAMRGLQVVTPGLARTLFGFGPVDAFSKPDLLQTLREILLSAELTRDQRSLLDLVLQVAVAATGADRGSLLLWDEREGVLRISTSLGIEEELLDKIRIAPGDGIAGKAFEERRVLLLQGKADRNRWQILRERDDVASAISAPLLHGERVLGVLNLSHARNHRQFDEEDRRFVEELARLDARILASAGEFERLVRESRRDRLEAELRRALAGSEALDARLHEACRSLGRGLGCALVELWLEAGGVAQLRGSSSAPGPAAAWPGPGLLEIAARERRPVWLAGSGADRLLRVAAIPLSADGSPLGTLVLQGQRERGDDDLEARWTEAAALVGSVLQDALAGERTRLASRRGLRLAEAVAALSTCRDLQQMADLVTSSAVLLLEAGDAVLRLRQDGSGRFPVIAWTGSGAWRRGARAEAERKLTADVLRSRRAQRQRLVADPAPGGPTIPALALPILREGFVLGSLCVLGRAAAAGLPEEDFSGEDEEALLRLLRCAAPALATLAPGAAGSGLRAHFADRRMLRERLVVEIARARNRGHRLLLIEIEIPGLGALEVERGETTAVGSELREALREFDLVARLEADRFAALVPEPDEERTALLARLARALRRALDRDVTPTRCPLLRMGYAVFPDDGDDAASLERKAASACVES